MGDKAVDYIIVGQGLAGSCLALQLLFLKKKILVVDVHNEQSATRIAAGLFNPITGRNLAKAWMADTLFPYLHSFYRAAEKFTESKFFYPMPLYRPFTSVEEQNEWMGRSSDESYTEYINSVHATPIDVDLVNNPLGGVKARQCGYVNTITFSEAVRNRLKADNSFLEEKFDEGEVSINGNFISYKNWSARKIIYCSGVSIRESKFFSWVPIRPLKGETLTFQSEAGVSTIYNRGVYVIPGSWKVGATYSLTDQTQQITEAGRLELEEKLTQLISFPYSIIDQQWGFRPTTHDRRPIIGPHPEFEQIVIFNGLGTKGISLAPYFSEVLTSWIEKGIPLDDVVAVNRYKSLYWKSA